MTSTDVTRLAIAVADNSELTQVAAEAMRISFYTSRIAMRELVALLEKQSEIESAWLQLEQGNVEYISLLELSYDDSDWDELSFSDVWEGFFNQKRKESILISLAEEAKHKNVRFSSLERFFKEYRLTRKEKLIFLEYYF